MSTPRSPEKWDRWPLSSAKKVLRQVAFEEFWSQIPALREKAGDRAVLRALHFYSDNDLVVQQKALLQAGNFEGFLSLVNQSGHSSAECLQNIFCCSTPDAQAVSLTIAAARRILKGRGAVAGSWRRICRYGSGLCALWIRGKNSAAKWRQFWEKDAVIF